MTRRSAALLLVAVLCVAALYVAAAPASARPVRSAEAACAVVKSFVVAQQDVPPSVPAFCDTVASGSAPSGYYVLALHGNRRCEGGCSTNMGWYAVEKSDGRLFEWDVAEQKLGAPLAEGR